ncbi:unnamed protein product [Rotaria sp. Silwood2]|nr:unnamed protein product [Rotaria sp. Silwood2]CAF4379450.1 unnamed protein product [Rotaria sp. Silwood2]
MTSHNFTFIKVRSTENGVIFSNIVYNVIDSQTEFECKNKIVISIIIRDISLYLVYLLNIANMRCSKPEKLVFYGCGFMTASLYAKLIYDENILANINIDKSIRFVDASIIGHIYMRTTNQGIALSM